VIFSPVLAVISMLMFILFSVIALFVATKRFPRPRGKTTMKLVGGSRWLLWVIPSALLAVASLGFFGSQMSPATPRPTYVKTVAQDRRGNAYIVLNDGETRRCGVAAECLALPDNTWVTTRLEQHGNDEYSWIRIVGKG